MNDLDLKIKEKFRLFQSVRPAEDDQKIYDKVTDLCFTEMLTFLGENLSETDMDELSNKIDTQMSDEDKNNVLMEYLNKIENYRFKLSHRLDSFLDSLLASNLTK